MYRRTEVLSTCTTSSALLISLVLISADTRSCARAQEVGGRASAAGNAHVMPPSRLRHPPRLCSRRSRWHDLRFCLPFAGVAAASPYRIRACMHNPPLSSRPSCAPQSQPAGWDAAQHAGGLGETQAGGGGGGGSAGVARAVPRPRATPCAPRVPRSRLRRSSMAGRTHRGGPGRHRWVPGACTTTQRWPCILPTAMKCSRGLKKPYRGSRR
jgi:hypothetical protein